MKTPEVDTIVEETDQIVTKDQDLNQNITEVIQTKDGFVIAHNMDEEIQGQDEVDPDLEIREEIKIRNHRNGQRAICSRKFN